jgi:hypothetical protein
LRKSCVAGILLAWFGLAYSASSATIGECLDFNPGIAYREELVERSNVTTLYDNLVSYSLVNVFSEQLAIHVLSPEHPSLAPYKLMKVDRAFAEALGVGKDASLLFAPESNSASNADLHVVFIPLPESTIFSDASSTIYVTTGFVKTLVDRAVRKVFGNVDGYQRHVMALAQTDHLGFLQNNNIRLELGAERISVPVGYMLFGKDVQQTDQSIRDLKSFTNEILTKLLFAVTHEVGHIRLKHNESPYEACDEFQDRELAADRYAAQYLTKLIFRMMPEQTGMSVIIDRKAFFENYDSYQFSGEDSTGACPYPDPRTREKEVKKAIYRETVRLMEQTFSAPDYATATPTSVICSSDDNAWRIEFDGTRFTSLDELRRKSIQQHQKP